MSTPENEKPQPKLPWTYKLFASKFPELTEAHEKVQQTVLAVGPLDARTCELIKIGISIGAGLESAVKAHVRKAVEHGATEKEIDQAVLLAMNTLGFPRTVAAWTWVHAQLDRKD